jgi:hypothetical protein
MKIHLQQKLTGKSLLSDEIQESMMFSNFTIHSFQQLSATEALKTELFINADANEVHKQTKK